MSAPRRVTVLYTALSALAAYTLLLVLRAPGIWRGRFWAEEGTMFFSAAWSGGLVESLLLPHAGYTMAVTSFATTLAARAAPLELAPLVTTGVSALVQLVPAVLLLTARIDALSDLRARWIALALLLVSLPTEEIWLNSANSSHFLAVCAGIILVSQPSASRSRFVYVGLLVLAGLSGIDANLLAPFFWLRAYQERSRARLEQAIALSTCAATQLLVVLIAPLYGFASVGMEGPRSPRLEPQILAHAMLAKDILLPFAGRAWTEHLMAPLTQMLAARQARLFVPAIVIAWTGLFAFAVVKSRQWQPRILLCLSLYMVAVSLTASIEASQRQWQLSHASALGAGRYYYLPNFFLALSLLMLACAGSALHKRLRTAALVLVAWMLLVGSYEFFRSDARPWFFSGPDWRREVAAWRRGETNDLKIWPVPWRITLDRTSVAEMHEPFGRDGRGRRALAAASGSRRQSAEPHPRQALPPDSPNPRTAVTPPIPNHPEFFTPAPGKLDDALVSSCADRPSGLPPLPATNPRRCRGGNPCEKT